MKSSHETPNALSSIHVKHERKGLEMRKLFLTREEYDVNSLQEKTHRMNIHRNRRESLLFMKHYISTKGSLMSC